MCWPIQNLTEQATDRWNHIFVQIFNVIYIYTYIYIMYNDSRRHMTRHFLSSRNPFLPMKCIGGNFPILSSPQTIINVCGVAYSITLNIRLQIGMEILWHPSYIVTWKVVSSRYNITPTSHLALTHCDLIAIWRQRIVSALAAPSHYRNQCWLMISTVQCHSYEDNFTRYTSTIIH